MKPRRLPTVALVAALCALAPAAPAAAAGSNAAEGLAQPTEAKAWIGRLLIPSVARVRPNLQAKPVTVVQPIAPLGKGPASLLVTDVFQPADGRDWVKVKLPIRPNGTEGWIQADHFRFVATDLSIVIDQSDRRLLLRRSGRVIDRIPVAIGTAATPTPTGRFAVAELIRTRNPGGFLGPVVFPLTGFSRVLNEYAGGNGRVAMHGTSLPQLIGTRASHGCIRIANRDVVRLSRLVRPGTPVTIRL